MYACCNDVHLSFRVHSLQILTENRENLNFGSLPWGCQKVLPVTLINTGRCSVPVRLAINSVSIHLYYNLNCKCQASAIFVFVHTCVINFCFRIDVLVTVSHLRNTPTVIPLSYPEHRDLLHLQWHQQLSITPFQALNMVK